MVNEHRGRLDGSGRRVAVVVSRFNDVVTRRLLDGALECLRAHGVEDGSIDVHWVAGAFEIPQMAGRLSRSRAADGIVCLGALVRGETIHFDVLANAVASSLSALGSRGEVPLSFGVLTADSMEQAFDRAGGKHGNAGWNAAQSLLELIDQWQA